MTIDDESEEGKIAHYDSLGKLIIEQCAMHSYTENGEVAYAKIAKGHVVVNGSIEMVYTEAESSSSVIVEGNVQHAHAKSDGAATGLNDNDATDSVTWDYDGEAGTTHEDNSTDHDGNPVYDPNVEGDDLIFEAEKEESSSDDKADKGAVVDVNTNTYYDTLAKAISAANAGDTLCLLQNASIGQIYNSIDYTIDVNGHNLTQTDGQVTFAWGHSLTITDSSTSKGNISLYRGQVTYGGTLILKDAHVCFRYVLMPGYSTSEYPNLGNNTILVDNCTYAGYFTVNGVTAASDNVKATFKNSTIVKDDDASRNGFYCAGYAEYTFESNTFDLGDEVAPLYFKAGTVKIKNNTFNCACEKQFGYDYICYGNGSFDLPSVIVIDEAPGYQGFAGGVEVKGNSFNLTGTYADDYSHLAYNMIPESTYTATIDADIASGKRITKDDYVAKRTISFIDGDGGNEQCVAYFTSLERANAYTAAKFMESGLVKSVTSFGDVETISGD